MTLFSVFLTGPFLNTLLVVEIKLHDVGREKGTFYSCSFSQKSVLFIRFCYLGTAEFWKWLSKMPFCQSSEKVFSRKQDFFSPYFVSTAVYSSGAHGITWFPSSLTRPVNLPGNHDTSSFYTVISRVTALSFQPYLPLKLITPLSFLDWFNSGQFLSYFSVNTGKTLSREVLQ